ncbi:unnamed protein product, partial [Laminaria digitata]
ARRSVGNTCVSCGCIIRVRDRRLGFHAAEIACLLSVVAYCTLLKYGCALARTLRACPADTTAAPMAACVCSSTKIIYFDPCIFLHIKQLLFCFRFSCRCPSLSAVHIPRKITPPPPPCGTNF